MQHSNILHKFGSRDTGVLSLIALIYSLGMGVQSILLPLLALAAGYSKPDIGILTALSAITQLIARMSTASAMRHTSDRSLIAFSGIALALAGFLVASSSALPIFVIAELVQGIARGTFWTATLTHAIRQKGPSVKKTATVNFVSSFGLLAGPSAAGYIARFSLPTALIVSGIIALLACIPTFFLIKEPPFSKEKGKIRRDIWNHPDVRLGCWAGFTAGSWRGILNSYVPVVLKGVGESYVVVGVLVSIANGASILGAGIMGALARRNPLKVFALGVTGAAVGTAFIGLMANSIYLSVLILAAGGVGAGILQTLGPVMAASGVAQHQKGDAVAIAGSFRAGALFAAPLLMAVLLGPLGIVGALVISGGILGLPIATARGAFAKKNIDTQTPSS